MLDVDHLELQDNSPEPKTRSELKRLILEYLKTRSREKLHQALPSEEVASWMED